MTMYTGLARVARKTGYPVVEVAGWKTRGHGGMGAVQSILCHHTVGPVSGNYPSLNVVTNGRTGLAGPLAQFGLGRDGTIYVIAAGLAYHSGAVKADIYRNVHSIGIEAENTGTGETWPAKQLDSYVKLCAALIDEFKLPVSRVVGHKEACSPVGRKIDPAFIRPAMTMAQFRGYVKKGAYKGGVAKPAPAKPKPSAKPKPPASTAKAWPAKDLPVTSKHTAASNTAWVRLMAAIGHKDKSLTLAIQKWLRGLGYYTTAYLLDGKWGPATTKALQRFLAKKGLYTRAIDGARGSSTIQAEIRYLNSQRKFIK
ncbi:MAG: peptidoglycan recognition protein family protein [Galactobacter sp.]